MHGGGGALYCGDGMQEGVGFAGMAPIDYWQGRRARPGLLPELGDDLTGGPHLSVTGERGN
jgi:hypothetical protein